MSSYGAMERADIKTVEMVLMHTSIAYAIVVMRVTESFNSDLIKQ